MKVELSQVAEAAKSIAMDPAKLRELIERLNDMQPEEEEKPPAIKKQFVILVSDPDGLLPVHEFAGWVLQIPENESPATTQERIIKGAYEYNTTKKGRLYPAKTLGEAIENIPAKVFKESEVWIKTKTPVLMLRTDNEVPNTEKTGKLDMPICINGRTMFITKEASQ